MAEPSVQCPLCKRVVKIVPAGNYYGLVIEEHNWSGVVGDLVDRMLQVQYSARCPMSHAAVEKKY